MRFPRVQSGEPLTARLWNGLVEQMERSLALASDGSLRFSRDSGGATIGVAPTAGVRLIEIRGGADYGDPVTANGYGYFQGRVNLSDAFFDNYTYADPYNPAGGTVSPFMPFEEVAVVTIGSYFGSEQDHTLGGSAPPPLLIHGDRFIGFRIANTANTLSPAADAPRAVYAIRPPEQVNIFYNASGEAVPSWAAMKFNGYRTVGSAGQLVPDVVKPNDSFARVYFINGEREVPAGKCGRFQPGPVVIAESTGVIAAGFGARVGPNKTSAWKIAEGGYGFRWIGQQPSGGLNYNQYQQDPPEVLLCEATADITAGSTGNTTYEILDAPGNILFGPGAGKVPNLTNRTNTKVNSGHKFYAWLSTDLTAEVLAPTQKFVAP